MKYSPEIVNLVLDLHRENIGEGRVPSWLATHLEVESAGKQLIVSGSSMAMVIALLDCFLDRGMDHSEALEELGLDTIRFAWRMDFFLQIMDMYVDEVVKNVPAAYPERTKGAR